jgi:hypothetical protein
MRPKKTRCCYYCREATGWSLDENERDLRNRTLGEDFRERCDAMENIWDN